MTLTSLGKDKQLQLPGLHVETLRSVPHALVIQLYTNIFCHSIILRLNINTIFTKLYDKQNKQWKGNYTAANPEMLIKLALRILSFTPSKDMPDLSVYVRQQS